MPEQMDQRAEAGLLGEPEAVADGGTGVAAGGNRDGLGQAFRRQDHGGRGFGKYGGVTASFSYDDPRQRWPDISRTWKLLGRKLWMPVSVGLEKVIGYYRELMA